MLIFHFFRNASLTLKCQYLCQYRAENKELYIKPNWIMSLKLSKGPSRIWKPSHKEAYQQLIVTELTVSLAKILTIAYWLMLANLTVNPLQAKNIFTQPIWRIKN